MTNLNMKNKENQSHLAKPLEGVMVLDLTHAYSGPFATMHLADQGATVIKLEVPRKGDQCRNWAPIKNEASGYFGYINRNKLGITLDLKSEEGKNVFKDLIKEVDILCENFRVGTMEKLGLGYDVLKEINPGLIYASISGFGLEGPMAKRPCYDIIAQAMGGMMSSTGFPDRMVKVGPAIADNYSGTYLSLGIVMALYEKEKTGKGRRLDVSMVDTIFSILESGVVEYTVNNKILHPSGNQDPSIAPFDSFCAKDGEFVMACGTDQFWSSLCEEMGMPNLTDDPRFITNASRCEHYGELKPIIESWTSLYDIDEIEETIVSAGIPFGRIQNIAQVCESDLIKEHNMLWEIYDKGIGEKIKIPGTPIKFQGNEDVAVSCAPLLGEHTIQILKETLHYSDEKISFLKENTVI